MKSLRIILVMVEPPLPFGNAAARWYYVLLKELVRRGHTVTAFASCSDAADIDACRSFFPHPQYDLRCFAVPKFGGGLGKKVRAALWPLSYMFSEKLREALQMELQSGFDILHLEIHWSGWLGLEHVERALINVHSLYTIDLDDAASGSFTDSLRRRSIFRAEASILRQYPHIVTLSTRLMEEVQKFAPRSTVQIVPLGLDVSFYPFRTSGSGSPTPTVTLIGSFGWRPTHSAAVRLLDHLWPGIKNRVPEARLQLVGRNARSHLVEYLGRPDVTILENVAEIIPYFHGADVMLYAPAVGSGMKVKVMEAFALGLPVVTTKEGVEGLPAEDGVHAGIADDDETLIDRTTSLLSNPEAQNRQRVAARRLIEDHCSPTITVDAIECIYRDILDHQNG